MSAVAECYYKNDAPPIKLFANVENYLYLCKRKKIHMGILKEIVNELKVEEFSNICESSLNRVVDWINNHDIATITASRYMLANVTNKTLVGDYPNGYVFTKQDNRTRNRDLKAKLLSFGYGVTNIHGSWIEGIGGGSVEVAEESFFVVNLNNDSEFFDNLFKLSEYFNQDSFLYKNKGDETAYLVGTNNAEFPGYGNKVATGTLTTLPSKFMSRIKNAAFAFVDKNNWIVKNKKSDLSDSELDDVEHSYSWKNDENPTFQNRKEKRVKDKEEAERQNKMAEDYVKMAENGGIILETIDDYKGFAKQALGFCAANVKLFD